MPLLTENVLPNIVFIAAATQGVNTDGNLGIPPSTHDLLINNPNVQDSVNPENILLKPTDVNPNNVQFATNALDDFDLLSSTDDLAGIHSNDQHIVNSTTILADLFPQADLNTDAQNAEYCGNDLFQILVPFQMHQAI